MFRIASQTFKRVVSSGREEICTFMELRSRTVFVGAILPRVARSQILLCLDSDLLRNRLPGAIHVLPFRGW